MHTTNSKTASAEPRRARQISDPSPSGQRWPASSATGIVALDPRTDPLWGRLVDRRGGGLFHTPVWIGAVSESYGFPVEAYVLLGSDGEPNAGIHFCRIRDPLGERIVSFPFSDFCDPLVQDRAEWDLLSDRLLSDGCPVLLRPLHSEAPRGDPRFAMTKEAAWHRVDLEPGLEALWKRLDPSLRWSINKAQREGVTLRFEEDSSSLRGFFDLHLGLRKRKYGLLAQPYGFFERVLERFVAERAGALATLRHQDQLIGAALFLAWGDTLYYKYSATSQQHVSLRTNDLLLWGAIQHGKALGLSSLDLGLSDLDQPGLISYKRKFASEEKRITFLRHSPVGSEQTNGELRMTLNQLTALLTDESVPDQVTERAGEILYRFFV